MTYRMNTLPQLHDDIEARVQLIRDNHPDWLCGLGCDGCCRRLAEIPLLTPRRNGIGCGRDWLHYHRSGFGKSAKTSPR